MCDCDGEGPSVYSETLVKRSRKNRRCCECGVLIPIGSSYVSIFGVWDWTAETLRMCRRCHALSNALRAYPNSECECVQFGELKTHIYQTMAHIMNTTSIDEMELELLRFADVQNSTGSKK